MKYFLPLLIVVLLVGCNNSFNRKEHEKIVKSMLSEFLVAVQDNDYDKLEQLTHSDFVIYENGSVWDLKRLSTELEGFQNVNVTYNLHDVHTIVDENVAHMQFLNTGTFIYPDTTVVLNFIESATFLRDSEDKWFIRFYHSTHLKRDSNENDTAK